MIGIDIWDALAEERRLAILATIQTAANDRARAERDLYASNFTDDPRVELLAVARDGADLVVRVLFHWWEYCAAQSGSDWNYDRYWQGTARFTPADLAHFEAVEVENLNISEGRADDGYDRAVTLAAVRARLLTAP